MTAQQTGVLPVRDEAKVNRIKEEKAEVANTKADEKADEKANTKAGSDDDAPLDPAKYIEAHILPRLDADVVDYYLNEVVKKASTRLVTIDYIRANPDKYRNLISLDTAEFSGVATYTLTSGDGGSFDVRLYYPLSDSSNNGGPYPVHLNFHGGGFVLGDLQTEAQLCLAMREAGVVVVDVNYRHCPETTWGKCFDDAWAALLWVRNSAEKLNINPDSISLGGVSAGAQITIVLHMRARDAGIPLRLVMPTVAPAAGSLFYKYYTDSPHSSFHEFVRSPILPWARIQYFSSVCLDSVTDAEADVQEGDDKETIRLKRIAFLRARWPAAWINALDAPPAAYRGLADVYLRTAELDNLRDEGEAYGKAVVAAGDTRVTIKRYKGAVHTFMYLDFNKQKRVFDIDSVVALRQAHGFAALTQEEVEARVDRVMAEVKSKQKLEKEARSSSEGDNAYA